MDPALALRAIQSTLDLERQIATRTATQLAEARELLRQIAAEHRAAERLGDGALRAGDHAALAARIEAHLAHPTPTRTQDVTNGR